jgi:hypothetical protein
MKKKWLQVLVAMVAAVMFSTAVWAVEPSVSQRLEITKVIQAYWGEATIVNFSSDRVVAIDDEGIAFVVFVVQAKKVIPRVIFCEHFLGSKQIAFLIQHITGEEP